VAPVALAPVLRLQVLVLHALAVVGAVDSPLVAPVGLAAVVLALPPMLVVLLEQ
jgi:hypothetical protein